MLVSSNVDVTGVVDPLGVSMCVADMKLMSVYYSLLTGEILMD